MTADAVHGGILPVMEPSIGDQEACALSDVLATGLESRGRRVQQFEAKFAGVQQAHHAVATSSATAALHLALTVAGIGAGDDVVVPSFAFIATANAVTYAGARPVFCDVDPVTGNATLTTIREALTLDTRAVVVVDQGGVPVDLDPVREFCDRHELTLIEDASSAVGSQYKDQPVGMGADITVWSFCSDKIVTAGGGGMLTTSRADWSARARILRRNGMLVATLGQRSTPLIGSELYLEVGFDYELPDLQAAVGTIQLGRLKEIVSRRREIAAQYAARLSDIGGLRFVVDPTYGTTNFQSFWLEVLPDFATDREGLLSRLALDGISAGRGMMASHRQPAYHWRDTGNVRLVATERLNDRTLVLPLYHSMDNASLDRVVSSIRAAAGVYRTNDA